jgi:chromate transporter
MLEATAIAFTALPAVYGAGRRRHCLAALADALGHALRSGAVLRSGVLSTGATVSVVGELFYEFAILSFVAFGGATALLPEMHRVVVDNHQWLDDATFTHLYAIAQAAPGPNVLVVTLIGWKVAGLAGALAATLAMCLPMSVLIYLLIDRWESFAGKRWQKAISLGVAPLAVGLVFSGATLIAQAAGLGWVAWGLVAATVVASLKTKWHPLWFIAIGAGFGLLGLV